MTVITRFAPSPTGNLHLGNLRIAIANALLSHSLEGIFILRYDDTDILRSSFEYKRSIAADLRWLGISWNQEIYQSDRISMYQEAADLLKERGYLYPCYETKEDLEFSRKKLLSQGKPPVYDRSALNLSSTQRLEFESSGRRPHWRFKLDHSLVSWTDLIRGEQKYSINNVSDPILIREDGTFLYTLPSVVDDISLGITHVIRGEDHVTNTAVQIQVIRALSEKINNIRFAHLPLLTDDSGGPLSKRINSLGISYFQDFGIEPMALCSFLTFLGTSSDIKPMYDLNSLSDNFNLKNVSRNPPKFNESDLLSLNAKYLRDAPFSMILEALGDVKYNEEFWIVVRDNIETLPDAHYWWEVCYGIIKPIINDSEYISVALDLLPKGDWDVETFGLWVKQIKLKTGRKGKELFQPLRLAITGRGDGPELKFLMPLIGYDKTVSRLRKK